MLNNDNQVEFHVLEAVSKSSVPVGSGYMKDALKGKGIEVSEATTGRILRDFDLLGYTERKGFKGRILTEKGMTRLGELEREFHRNFYGNELINVIKVKGKQEFIDILIARKAIEREIAKQAASKIKDEDLKILQDIILKQERHSHEDVTIVQEDVDFHKTIAKIACNRILETAMELIRHDSQLTPVLEYIRKKVKSAIVTDHQRILDALKDKDPDKAEEAMVAHIENLISDVNKYWTQV